jgi:hypothetical protein
MQEYMQAGRGFYGSSRRNEADTCPGGSIVAVRQPPGGSLRSPPQGGGPTERASGPAGGLPEVMGAEVAEGGRVVAKAPELADDLDGDLLVAEQPRPGRAQRGGPPRALISSSIVQNTTSRSSCGGMDVKSPEPSDIDRRQDVEWSREVTLRLAPHPDLKDGKRRAVELDFGMNDGILEVKTRLCLVYYIERQYGLDQDTRTLAAERHQIVLANRAEIEEIRNQVGSSKERPSITGPGY